MNYKQQKLIVLLVLTCVIGVEAFVAFSIMVVFLVNGAKILNFLPPRLSIAFLNTLTNLYFAQLLLACITTRKRFEGLNKYLEDSLPPNNIKTLSPKAVSPKHLEISQLSKFYHELCDAIEIINESFTFHFIFLFGYLTVRLSLSLDNISFTWYLINSSSIFSRSFSWPKIFWSHPDQSTDSIYFTSLIFSFTSYI